MRRRGRMEGWTLPFVIGSIAAVTQAVSVTLNTLGLTTGVGAAWIVAALFIVVTAIFWHREGPRKGE